MSLNSETVAAIESLQFVNHYLHSSLTVDLDRDELESVITE